MGLNVKNMTSSSHNKNVDYKINKEKLKWLDETEWEKKIC